MIRGVDGDMDLTITIEFVRVEQADELHFAAEEEPGVGAPGPDVTPGEDVSVILTVCVPDHDASP